MDKAAFLTILGLFTFRKKNMEQKRSADQEESILITDLNKSLRNAKKKLAEAKMRMATCVDELNN
ncbi:MAG: hypothetical protein GY870_15720 [archaeon]|nr:hypothetical protein [archaeon]